MGSGNTISRGNTPFAQPEVFLAADSSGPRIFVWVTRIIQLDPPLFRHGWRSRKSRDGLVSNGLVGVRQGERTVSRAWSVRRPMEGEAGPFEEDGGRCVLPSSRWRLVNTTDRISKFPRGTCCRKRSRSSISPLGSHVEMERSSWPTKGHRAIGVQFLGDMEHAWAHAYYNVLPAAEEA